MQRITSETASNELAGVVVQGESGRAKGIERPQREDLGHIYQLYSRRVFALCLRMTGNVDEAEDLTQQVFLQLYKKLDTFRGESSLYTWLHRLAVNVVLMRLRERRVSYMAIYILASVIAVMVLIMVVTKEGEEDSPFAKPARPIESSRLSFTPTRRGLANDGKNPRKASRRFAGLPPTVESS